MPEQAAFHPVSRRPAQTSGVRKRLPYSIYVRPEMTPTLATFASERSGNASRHLVLPRRMTIERQRRESEGVKPNLA